MNDLIIVVIWLLLIVFFMYTSLKFISNKFNIHPMWILAIVPVNLVWFAFSMLLADGVFFIVGKIVGHNFFL